MLDKAGFTVDNILMNPKYYTNFDRLLSSLNEMSLTNTLRNAYWSKFVTNVRLKLHNTFSTTGWFNAKWLHSESAKAFLFISEVNFLGYYRWKVTKEHLRDVMSVSLGKCYLKCPIVEFPHGGDSVLAGMLKSNVELVVVICCKNASPKNEITIAQSKMLSVIQPHSRLSDSIKRVL